MVIFKNWREYRDKLMNEDSQWDWPGSIPSEHMSLGEAGIIAALFIIAEVIEAKS
jgi:hypothetical protein